MQNSPGVDKEEVLNGSICQWQYSPNILLIVPEGPIFARSEGVKKNKSKRQNKNRLFHACGFETRKKKKKANPLLHKTIMMI